MWVFRSWYINTRLQLSWYGKIMKIKSNLFCVYIFVYKILNHKLWGGDKYLYRVFRVYCTLTQGRLSFFLFYILWQKYPRHHIVWLTMIVSSHNLSLDFDFPSIDAIRVCSHPCRELTFWGHNCFQIPGKSHACNLLLSSIFSQLLKTFLC